ncbi:hypothetical protein HN018_02905 [Lichenicola cladoniae]|uniref:Uncharacterized protein n=1 Tax=Lichenicola cladoniae TaxID=1484109 RepID=A0A6M8HLB5_9PROT|nr:hypothetical protein [Lichenicola cladoniae]NPD68916.1 hypothetical protein [Acetobacteraceae bacterium]QKE89138.1 hypothetical protein HN018_02905 [Lichenicola cladoniae]
MPGSYVDNELEKFGDELRSNGEHFAKASALSAIVENQWQQAISTCVELQRFPVSQYGLRLTDVTAARDLKTSTASVTVAHQFNKVYSYYGTSGKFLVFKFDPCDLKIHVDSAADTQGLLEVENIDSIVLNKIVIDHAVAILRATRLRPVTTASVVES